MKNEELYQKIVDDFNFNKGVDFDQVYGRDIPVRYAVLRTLNGRVGRANRITREKLVGKVAFYWYFLGNPSDPPGDRKIRNTIRELRREGALILSTGGTEGGYWLTESQEEVKAFVKQEFWSRAIDLFTTAAAMTRASVRVFGGQVNLWKKEVKSEVNSILNVREV